MDHDAKVHIIDDDSAVRDSLAFLLGSFRIPTATYAAGTAFLAALTGHESGCVVTDIRMPEISGIDLLRRLKELKVQMPVIVITGHGDVPLAVEAMKLGATDADLAKPRELLSKAQLWWDYVASNNGMGFHAPQECARVLGRAIYLGNQSRMETQRVLAKRGVINPVTMPDISTFEKATAYTKPYADAQKAAAAKH